MEVTPVTAGVKFLPLGKFRRVSPYVGGGFGLYVYEYQEEGEFIDFDVPSEMFAPGTNLIAVELHQKNVGGVPGR